MTEHKFPYKWTLKDANFTKDKGKVFSCFACGGGSTMGYKLAGFDVIGCNEIDPKMAECYKVNHHPKYAYIEPIQTFKLRSDLPEELYNLDILDGSPPCSSFSTAGNREKDWGKEKKFREGQAEQVLDTLFFDFIDLAKKLQPKVVIAENVKGMLIGDAKEYVDAILRAFYEAGYYVDYKLLDASKMGVPQKRERIVFYSIRKDLYKGEFYDLFGTCPILNLDFNEYEIPFECIDDGNICGDNSFMPFLNKYWDKWIPGTCYYLASGKSGFNYKKVDPKKPILTIPAHTDGGSYHHLFRRQLTNNEYIKAGTFPFDYDFISCKPKYIIGMSVPPVMMAQIATRVYEQWLRGLK